MHSRKKGHLPGRLLATVLTLALVCAVIAPAAFAAKKPTLSRKTAALIVGENMTLKVRRKKGKVWWRSSNKKIVTVKKGRVKAKKKGKAKIYAYTSKRKLTCKVVVERPYINRTTATLVKGKTLPLKLKGTTQKVKWKSSNAAVASVTSKGVLKAKAAGSATVTGSIRAKKYRCKVKVEKPVLSRTSTTMIVGKTLALKLNGTTQPVTWKSYNTAVVSMSAKGIVTAKAAGTATVSAVVQGKAFPCKVKVEKPVLSKTSAMLIVGKTLALKLNGTTQPVNWKSSNKKIATVTAKGVVTAKAAGIVSVTATVQGKSFSCKVRVEKPVLSKTAATLIVGKKLTLKLSGTTQPITWKSSNMKVATVTTKGVVTAKTAGTVNVTATVQGKAFMCKVTVNPYISAKTLTMMLNRSETLKIVGASQTVTWKSSNTGIATVSSKGVVTSKKAGNAVITGTVLGKTYTCKVTVLPAVSSTAVTYEDKMIQLISDLSGYAKQKKTNFAMIPNGGYELYSPETPVAKDLLLSCVDGVLIESAFYGWDDMDDPTPSRASRAMLNSLAYAKSMGKATFNMEYCEDLNALYDAEQRSAQAGTVCFVATSRELDNVPSLAPERTNNLNCTNPASAQNFLALLNSDHYRSKAEYLNAIRNTNYDLVFIDLYYDGEPLTRTDVNSLKKKKNGATRMVCAYLSVGEAEDYREYWKPAWDNEETRPSWICEENEDWEGNYKVKYWSQSWRSILYGSSSGYLDRILNAGFDGAYLDVVDAYEYFATSR